MANLQPFLELMGKEYLKRLLRLCRPGEVGKFQAMYATQRDEHPDLTVQNLPYEKLDHAVFQVENSLDKKKSSLFTVEAIRAYIESKDSLGDVLYFLSAENIGKAIDAKLKNEL